MNIDQIVKRFSEGKSLASLKQALSKGTRSIAVEGLQGSATAILLHALTDAQRPILAIAREGELAAYLQNDLAVLLGDEQVSFFPLSIKRRYATVIKT